MFDNRQMTSILAGLFNMWLKTIFQNRVLSIHPNLSASPASQRTIKKYSSANFYEA